MGLGSTLSWRVSLYQQKEEQKAKEDNAKPKRTYETAKSKVSRPKPNFLLCDSCVWTYHMVQPPLFSRIRDLRL